jgi:hypothetical protein
MLVRARIVIPDERPSLSLKAGEVGKNVTNHDTVRNNMVLGIQSLQDGIAEAREFD